jgi:hypothetical protein
MSKIFGPRAALNRMLKGITVMELYPMTDYESITTYKINKTTAKNGCKVMVRLSHGVWKSWCRVRNFTDHAKGARFKEAAHD